MASRLIALVEHPALEGNGAGVDVTTRRRMGAPERPSGPRGRAAQITPEAGTRIVEEEREEPDPVDVVREAERSGSR